MTTRDDGGSAFPIICTDDLNIPNERGMSLRDYFAAKAMQAVVSKLPFYATRDGAAIRVGCSRVSDEEYDELTQAASVSAYAIADAMLEARKR